MFACDAIADTPPARRAPALYFSVSKGWEETLMTWKPAAKQDQQALTKFGENFSPNSVVVKTLASVAELKADYDLHHAAIQKAISAYTSATGNIYEHLSYMQSLLSKQGANHKLVIEARKQGHNIPWWTEYYEMFDGILKESLRTMQSRLKAYRAGDLGDASKKKDKPNPDYQFNKAERTTVVAAVVAGRELADAIEAGRDGKAEVKAFRKIQHGDRLNDVLAAAEAAPDYHKAYNDAMRGLKTMLEAFEKQDANKALPADLRKLVRDTRKAFFGKADLAPKKAKSAVGELISPKKKEAPVPREAPTIVVKTDGTINVQDVYKVREVTNPAGNTWALIKNEVVVRSDLKSEEEASAALDTFKQADEAKSAVVTA
jgi:hypothetical protein